MNARDYQIEMKERLELIFSEVVMEWPISRGAGDSLSYDAERYSPRIDVAVGPFNNQTQNIRGCIEERFESETPRELKQRLRSSSYVKNRNPRCMLAIEVVFSGSSKHMMGDIANASMMGLYGLILTNEKTFEKVKRIYEYLHVIRQLGKAPDQLFQNVTILKADEIVSLLPINLN